MHTLQRYSGDVPCLVSASHTPLNITGTTPPTAVRHAIVESKAAKLSAGQQQYFMNLLYSSHDHDGWPYDIAMAAPGVAMIKAPDGYALAGTGRSQPLPRMHVEAGSDLAELQVAFCQCIANALVQGVVV